MNQTLLVKNTYVNLKGTFHSTKCSRLGNFSKNMCPHCADIPKCDSFRKRALLRNKKTDGDGKRNTLNIRNQYLTTEETQTKLKDQQTKIDEKDSQLFLLGSKAARLSVRNRNYKEKIEEFSKRGSMKAIAYQFQRAADEGKLDDQRVLCSLLESVSKNLNMSKQGRRYSSPMQSFMEVILLWGGPRLANFVAMNLFGPEIHTIFRWRKAKAVELAPGLSDANFIIAKEIYTGIMQRRNLRKVPVLISEDETAVTAQIVYAEDKDALVGFCGPLKDHQCTDNQEIKVGDGEQGYLNLTKSFKENKIGTLARAVLLNPIHPDLPKIPILVHPTCNKFNANFVRQQWKEIGRLYKLHLEDTLGPLLGQSSDGDARRRHLMMETANDNKSTKFQPIPKEERFLYTCNQQQNPDGTSYSISDLFDQDYIHNHKKVINHLFHASKDLMMGTFHVHSNHLTLVNQMFRYDEHGLQAEDLTRSDRQNWRSAQRICFLKVQTCLQRLLEGSVGEQLPDETVRGTLIFIKVVWAYVEIFCSGRATLRQRITYAALVSHFLELWRKFIIITPGSSLKNHFISRESYTDVRLSCHFAVSLICYMRDNHPALECRLDLTGTDIVESFWSKNGQWIGNRRTYTFERLQRNLTHMIRLEQIRVEPEAPDFAKPHPKVEMIWASQYACSPPDLTDYPAEGDERKAWQEGLDQAVALAAEAGMTNITLDAPGIFQIDFLPCNTLGFTCKVVIN